MRLRMMVVVAFTAMVFCACDNKNKKREEPLMVEKETVAVADSMLYGTCGEGSAMHTLELVAADGKSRSFTLEGGKVFGGLLAGDSVAVLSRRSVDGTPLADIVVNITSLADRWVSLDQTLELHKDGKALTKAKEGNPIVDWRLCNGRLVIGADTFAIRTLGPDSLYLVKGKELTGYRRM